MSIRTGPVQRTAVVTASLSPPDRKMGEGNNNSYTTSESATTNTPSPSTTTSRSTSNSLKVWSMTISLVFYVGFCTGYSIDLMLQEAQKSLDNRSALEVNKNSSTASLLRSSRTAKAPWKKLGLKPRQFVLDDLRALQQSHGILGEDDRIEELLSSALLRLEPETERSNTLHNIIEPQFTRCLSCHRAYYSAVSHYGAASAMYDDLAYGLVSTELVSFEHSARTIEFVVPVYHSADDRQMEEFIQRLSRTLHEASLHEMRVRLFLTRMLDQDLNGTVASSSAEQFRQELQLQERFARGANSTLEEIVSVDCTSSQDESPTRCVLMQEMVCITDDCIVVKLDSLDTHIQPSFLLNCLAFATPGVTAYFPVASTTSSSWKTQDYGAWAMAGSDVVRLDQYRQEDPQGRKREKETTVFFELVTRNLNIVRLRDSGVITRQQDYSGLSNEVR